VSGEQKLKATLARLRPRPPPPLEIQPTNAWEVMIAERLQGLRDDVDQLQTRLWWLFALIIGAAIANVIVGLLQ